MNLQKLQDRLLAVARANPPSDQVPYAFEKRVMAHLAARPALDEWGFWARGLWRAAAPCVAITLLFSAWSFFAGPSRAPVNNLSQEIDNTVLAAVDQESSVDWVR